MRNLKEIRKGLKMSQADMAKLFNCTQAFISQIENNRTEMPDEYQTILIGKFGKEKIGQMNDSLILKAFGWKDASDPQYKQLKEQLLDILFKIRQKTGLTNEEISQKIYRNNKTIPEAIIDMAQVSPNMITYIMKRLEKIGLSSSDILTEENKPQKVLHFNDLANFIEFQFNLAVAKATTDIQFGEIDCDYFVNAPFQMSENFNIEDILAISEVNLDDINFNRLYVILFKDQTYNIQYILQGPSNKEFNLSMELPAKLINKITKVDIQKVFMVKAIIKIQKC